jgi:hypothetical protein
MTTVKEHFGFWWWKVAFWDKWTQAQTLLPFGIIYRMTEAETLAAAYYRRHEWQHVSQIRRVGWWGFYPNYVWQMIKGLFKYGPAQDYSKNTWEADAIAHQFDKTWPDNCPDHPDVPLQTNYSGPA